LPAFGRSCSAVTNNSHYNFVTHLKPLLQPDPKGTLVNKLAVKTYNVESGLARLNQL